MNIVKNKKMRVTLVLIVTLLFLCSACTLKDDKTSDYGNQTNQDASNDLIEIPPSKNEDATTTDPSSSEEEPLENEDGVQAEKTQPESSKPFWQSETARITSNLISIASAAQTDYKVNGAKRGWMSKNGELYAYYDKKYITTDALVADGYLESGLLPSNYRILLVNGSDLEGLDGISVPSDSLNFGVFAAMKQSGKYLIASPSGKVGTISEKNFDSLLAKYNQNNGSIVRLSSASAEYERILNYICLFEGRFAEYYVREIRMDNKYAVVVFSNKTNTADIKQYILENENNFWEVVFPNMQTEYYPVTTVNRYLPNFNVELLPNYTLASWRGAIYQEQGGAVAGLFSANAISSADEIVYQCATATCAYVVLKNEKRYVCYSENGIWKAEYASSDFVARNLLKEKMGIDYGFLILDD